MANNEIGQAIKNARVKAGLTQEELAKKCNLATITIRQYESGRRGLNVKQLAHVARAMGVDWADLVPDVPPDAVDPYTADSEAYEAQIIQDKIMELRSRLLFSYDALNDEGKQKAVERIEELTEISRYCLEDAP